LLAPIALLPLLGAGKKYKGRVRELIMRSVQEGHSRFIYCHAPVGQLRCYT
jgi:hypothetical protein